MSITRESEEFISKADEFGAGIAALGDMLQWAPREDVQHTVRGLGIVLRQLGEGVRTMSDQYLHSTATRLQELENKDSYESRIGEARAELKEHTENCKSTKEALTVILNEALTKATEIPSESTR